jgi:hypothetical protein
LYIVMCRNKIEKTQLLCLFTFLSGTRTTNSCRVFSAFSNGLRAIAQAVSCRLPTAAALIRARVWSCVICGEQSGTGESFLPCQFSFHRLLHTHISPGAATIGQIVADVLSGLRPLSDKTHGGWTHSVQRLKIR